MNVYGAIPKYRENVLFFFCFGFQIEQTEKYGKEESLLWNV